MRGAKGLGAGRASGYARYYFVGVSCRWYPVAIVLPLPCCCHIVAAVAAAVASRPCHRCNPVAIALSQPRFARQQRGASEFPFACAPQAILWLVGFYSARAPVMAPAASQATMGQQWNPSDLRWLPSEKRHRPLVFTQRVDGEPQPAYLCVYWPWRLVLELR